MTEAAGLNWIVVAGAVLWAVIVAVVGSRLTIIDAWYFNLEKPGWKPPDWAFGVIWTAVFICAGIALYRGWTLAPDGVSKAILAGLFVFNGACNIAWNVLFFTWRRPDWALPGNLSLDCLDLGAPGVSLAHRPSGGRLDAALCHLGEHCLLSHLRDRPAQSTLRPRDAPHQHGLSGLKLGSSSPIPPRLQYRAPARCPNGARAKAMRIGMKAT